MKIQKVVMHRRQGRWNIRGEVMPARGKDYIFFIETLNQGQRVIKVLLKTDENIRRLSVP